MGIWTFVLSSPPKKFFDKLFDVGYFGKIGNKKANVFSSVAIIFFSSSFKIWTRVSLLSLNFSTFKTEISCFSAEYNLRPNHSLFFLYSLWFYCFLLFYLFIYFLLTILYWFCHTLTWIHHGFHLSKYSRLIRGAKKSDFIHYQYRDN